MLFSYALPSKNETNKRGVLCYMPSDIERCITSNRTEIIPGRKVTLCNWNSAVSLQVRLIMALNYYTGVEGRVSPVKCPFL